MKKNKAITLLASILSASTLMAMPLIAVVNNVSSNTNLIASNDENEVIGTEDFEDSDYSANEISEKENSDFNNKLINDINNEINVNFNDEQTAAHYFDVYQNDLINAGWGDITTKGTHLTFEVISDGGTDDTREVRIIKPQTAFRAENFSIQSTVYDAKVNKTYKVVEVAAGAFEYPSLAATLSGSLTIGNNIKNISSRAFYDQSNITNLDLGSSILSIGDKAFCECEKIAGNLIIPDSVLTIGTSAFSNCKGFNGNLIIGNNVQTIGDYAFEKCMGFKGDLIIPDSVTYIGAWIFVDSYGFDGDLTIGSGIKLIPNSLFKDYNFTGTLIIKSGVESIGKASFFNCKFSNIIIEDGLKKIYSSAFSNNTKLIGDLIIPSSVDLIDENAFENCGIGTLIIKGPENNDSTVIKGYAFVNCPNLETLIFEKNIAFDYQNALRTYGYVDYPFENSPVTHVSYFCTKPPSILYPKSYFRSDDETLWDHFPNGPVIVNSRVPQVDGATFVNCSTDVQEAFRNTTTNTEVRKENFDKDRIRNVWESIPMFPESTFNDVELVCDISYLDLENQKIDSTYNTPLIYKPLFNFDNGGDAFKNDITWKINNFSNEECADIISLNESSGEITISPGLVNGNYFFDISGWTSNGMCLVIHKVIFEVANLVQNIQIDNTDVDVTYKIDESIELKATVDSLAFNKELTWSVTSSPQDEDKFSVEYNDQDNKWYLIVSSALAQGNHNITLNATATDGSNSTNSKLIAVNVNYAESTEITIDGDYQINILSNDTKQVPYKAKTLQPGNANPNPEVKWSVIDKNSKGITIDPDNGVLDIPVISEVGIYPVTIRASYKDTVTASFFVNINVYGNDVTDLTIVGDKIINVPTGTDTTYEYEIQSNPSGGNTLAAWSVVDINTRDPIDGITIEPKNDGSHAILKINSTVAPSNYQMQIIATPKAGHQLSRPVLDIGLNVQNIVPNEIKINGPQEVNSIFSVGSLVNYTATINDGATPSLKWELDYTYPGIKLQQTTEGATLKIDDSIQNDTEINIVVSSTVGDKKQIYPVDIKINYAPAQSIDIKGQNKITHIYGGDQTTIDFDAIVHTNDSEVLTSQEVNWTIETTVPDKIGIDKNGKIIIDSNLPKGNYDIKITATSALTPEIFKTEKVTIVSNYANTEKIDIIGENAIIATIGQSNMVQFDAKTSSSKGITNQQVYWEIAKDTLINGITIDFLTGKLNVDTKILNQPQTIKISIIAKALQPNGQYITKEKKVTILIIGKNPINLGAIIGGTIGGVVGVGAITGGSIYAVKYAKSAKAKKTIVKI